jgi:hypothetical protein
MGLCSFALYHENARHHSAMGPYPLAEGIPSSRTRICTGRATRCWVLESGWFNVHYCGSRLEDANKRRSVTLNKNMSPAQWTLLQPSCAPGVPEYQTLLHGIRAHPKMKPGPGVADNLCRRTRQVPKVPSEYLPDWRFSPGPRFIQRHERRIPKPPSRLSPFSATCLGMVAWSASEGATQWQLSAQIDRQLGRTVPFHRQMMAIRILPLSASS